ncbi:glycosyl hydrolase [Nesterenkonia sp.]|uniref:glycosyl hydrolase n=1 Tax=Nesterenkonia sp. TaxID=704201 RepID=UPI00261189EE|nr:glycosyl hydrolase [Nesterenkonia sp.]
MRPDQLHAGFRNPDPDARVMMRWWWFGPDVDRDDLTRDLDHMAAAGLGGVECAFVYPMGATAGTFGSQQFLDDVAYAASAAEARGLRFDLTLGSGWPYGGPHIDERTASRRLHFERHEVRMEPARIPVPTCWPGDEFVAAFIADGTPAETYDGFTPVPTDDTGEHLLVPAGRGPRVLLTVVSRISGQTLKRAARGAEGWVLDHLSAEATRAHIDAVAEPLVDAAGSERIGTVFCDSLEVYDAGWTPRMPEEFRRRRGYDLLPQLWKLPQTDEATRQLRADYHRTATELLEENFIAVMSRWAESRGLRFRIQAYGQPPATVSSYRYAHAFEGEGWGWNRITACRWASSAAQIYGRDVVSSECWTWNHSPSFRSTPLDLLGEAHDHLLMGINHFVGHGWPTTDHPEDPRELGRIFYASAALDSRNAWWDAAPSLWGTLHRLAWLMRQGTRISDVGIYVPARDIYAGFSAAGRIDLFKEAQLYIGGELPETIRTAGSDFDLFDDDAVEHLDPARFPVVVLPCASDIPEPTRQWLQQVARAGGTVVDLGGTAGIGQPLSDAAGLAALLRPAVGLRRVSGAEAGGQPETNTAVAVTTRQLPSGARIHLVVNTSAETQPVQLSLGGAEGTVVERWDPETGEVRAHWDTAEITLGLQAYEAAVLVQHTDAQRRRNLPAAQPELSGQRREELSRWSVQFPDQTQPQPVTLPHQWEQDPQRSRYSGSAIYTTEVQIPADAKRIVLDFGAAEPHTLEDPASAGLMEASFSAEVRPPVGTVAAVLIDSAPAGVVWKTPYRLEITDAVRPGARHQLQLVVSNVTSHTLAEDQGLRRRVAQAEENFGKRFGIQALELALADVSSGLLAAPHLVYS